MIEVETGNGSFSVDDWHELWECMWKAVAYALNWSLSNGQCLCGCEHRECLYCIHECGGDL